MEQHQFVVIDDININATHLLGMDKDKAVKELLANDQVPGKDDDERSKWAAGALEQAGKELEKRKKKTKSDAAPVTDLTSVVANPSGGTPAK